MVRSGSTVFATVRKEQDGARLRSDFGARITPIIVNVTGRASIIAAAERVTALIGGSGLNGLVDVAGVGEIHPVPHNLIHMRNSATICCLNLVLNIFAAIISHAPKLPRHFGASEATARISYPIVPELFPSQLE
jgi:hypothetical protein